VIALLLVMQLSASAPWLNPKGYPQVLCGYTDGLGNYFQITQRSFWETRDSLAVLLLIVITLQVWILIRGRRDA
jgi:hypothetical protein